MSKFKKYKPQKFGLNYPKFDDEVQPHMITEYEKGLIKLLCPVIENKQIIKFYYSDKSNDFQDWRIVEPHLIGIRNTKDENIWLSAWFLPTTLQISQGHKEGWKNYILDDLKKVEVLDQKYVYSRPKYNPKDSRMKSIYCSTDKNSNP